MLATVMWGGTKDFHPLKGGHKMFYPVLRGGGPKKFRTSNFHIL